MPFIRVLFGYSVLCFCSFFLVSNFGFTQEAEPDESINQKQIQRTELLEKALDAGLVPAKNWACGSPAQQLAWTGLSFIDEAESVRKTENRSLKKGELRAFVANSAAQDAFLKSVALTFRCLNEQCSQCTFINLNFEFFDDTIKKDSIYKIFELASKKLGPSKVNSKMFWWIENWPVSRKASGLDHARIEIQGRIYDKDIFETLKPNEKSIYTQSLGKLTINSGQSLTN